jgi:hypothetical protein
MSYLHKTRKSKCINMEGMHFFHVLDLPVYILEVSFYVLERVFHGRNHSFHGNLVVFYRKEFVCCGRRLPKHGRGVPVYVLELVFHLYKNQEQRTNSLISTT